MARQRPFLLRFTVAPALRKRQPGRWHNGVIGRANMGLITKQAQERAKMNGSDEQYGFQEGMEVHGSDGAKVGTISEVSADHFVVNKGFFFPNDYYIPTSAVNNVEDDKVYLNVTKDEAMSQDPSWEERPVGVASSGAAGSSGYPTDTTSSGM